MNESLLMPASSAAAFPPKIPTVAKAMPAGVAARLAANGVPGISVPTGRVPMDAPAGTAEKGVFTILVCVCSHSESAVTFTYIAQTSRHRGA